MKTEPRWGYVTGDICNRKTCQGIIQEHDKGVCSCHNHPPCSACTEPRAYCETCGWEEKDEQHMNGFVGQVDRDTGVWKSYERRQLDPTKIDYHILDHTHFSQICEGVYPEGTLMKDVLEQVKGTFGGRFEYFGNGKFKYIAYTD